MERPIYTSKKSELQFELKSDQVLSLKAEMTVGTTRASGHKARSDQKYAESTQLRL